mmetsp:Transcript_20877/g.38733  ORF Transcript_20877/g.38733 Transcript_20877/m.38733 type:complete len:203 (-) Transcript_20877:7-615(-)
MNYQELRTFIASKFKQLEATFTSSTHNANNLWNTSGTHYISLNRKEYSPAKASIDFKDFRLYFNSISDASALLTIRDQMNSRCSEECLECDSPDSCISCMGGFYLQSGECKNCHYSCYTCASQNSNSCLSCSGDLYLNSDNTCQYDCPVSWFKGTGNKCTACISQCQTCDGAASCIQARGEKAKRQSSSNSFLAGSHLAPFQ